MVNYRRNYLPGGTFFFTASLQDRSKTYLVDNIECFRQSVRLTKQKYPFEIIAAVVLPDHVHMIWQLPQGESDFSKRWQMIKKEFTKSLLAHSVPVSRKSENRYNLWQSRFWEYTIRNEQDLERCINYIHYNPVKHSYVTRVWGWPFSSFHQYVSRGVLSVDWGDNITLIETSLNE
ncbi:MAG: transposase [Cellvibrionaceae bacterium]